jgi:protein tyrosine/serine phosphatase
MAVPGLPDLGKVDDSLYRGAQPKTKGIDELKKMGVDTIVDLRGERQGLREKERKHAESLGMRFVNIPGYGWASPSDKEMAQFFALVNEQPKRQIFIHCWLGGDRVGMFVAAYRITFDGWTTDHAVQEMRAFHFKEHWHENMKRYVEDFPQRLARSSELAPYRQMASTKPQQSSPTQSSAPASTGSTDEN